MGLLTDFFLAPAKDLAGKRGDQVQPWKFKRRLEGKGVDTLLVEKLGGLVGVDVELVPSEEDTEQWLFALSPEFISALARLNDAKRKKIANRWDAPESFLDTLCELARESEATGVPMWFWMSL
jgi:hypothetical protein